MGGIAVLVKYTAFRERFTVVWVNQGVQLIIGGTFRTDPEGVENRKDCLAGHPYLDLSENQRLIDCEHGQPENIWTLDSITGNQRILILLYSLTAVLLMVGVTALLQALHFALPIAQATQADQAAHSIPAKPVAVLASQSRAAEIASALADPPPAWREVLDRKRASGIFDVFLCHHTDDKPTVKEIGQRLKEAGLLPWLDIWELPPGQPWLPLLEQQIGNIRAAAVFVGSAGIGPWQKRELYSLLSEFVERNVPVMAVDGCATARRAGQAGAAGVPARHGLGGFPRRRSRPIPATGVGDHGPAPGGLAVLHCRTRSSPELLVYLTVASRGVPGFPFRHRGA